MPEFGSHVAWVVMAAGVNNVDLVSRVFGALGEVFTYENLVHAVAGGTGSVVGLTAFFPLDTARTRLQVEDKRKNKFSLSVVYDIFREEGLAGVYRGWFPVVSTLYCSNFVYFYFFHGLKAVARQSGYQSSVLADLLFALIAGIVNVVVTNPLWVVNTRLKFQGAHFKLGKNQKQNIHPQYSGIIDALYKIWRQEGARALWSGMVPSLVLVSNPTVQFALYEALKRYLQHWLRLQDLGGPLYFLIGAVAKMVATFLTYPMQIVQSRLRAGFDQDKKNPPSTIYECLAYLFRNQGVAGLYKGLEAKLLQTVLTAALMFLTYEKIAAVVFQLMGLQAAT